MKERALIDWLLRHGNPGSEQFLEQLDSLVVVWKCSCGCPTVDFKRGEAGAYEAKHIIANYLATVDGEDVGIMLFQRGGHLVHLRFTLRLVATRVLVFLRSNPFIRTKSWLNAKGSEPPELTTLRENITPTLIGPLTGFCGQCPDFNSSVSALDCLAAESPFLRGEGVQVTLYKKYPTKKTPPIKYAATSPQNTLGCFSRRPSH